MLIRFIRFIEPIAKPLAVGFVCWLGGCADAPQRNPADLSFARPQQWHAGYQPASRPLTAWVKSFADPKLSALVETSLFDNFDLKTAAARIDAARQQAVIAGAGRLPQLQLAPGYVRGKSPGASETGSFDALFNFSWELDIWGRIKAQQQAAGLEAEAVLGDFSGARLSLATLVAQSYFELIEAKLQAEVAAKSVQDRSTIADLIQGRFNRGLTGGLDLRLVLTDVANAKAQLAQAENTVQQLTKRLQTLLGHYPDGLIDYGFKLPDPPTLLSPGLPSELLTRRPDIIAAFARWQAADSRLESAQKALLPRLTLTAAGGTSSPALTELADARSAAWNVAAGLIQPIFTGGQLRGQIRFTEAEVRIAANQYQSTVLNAFREVEQALAAEAWLRGQEQALREAVEQTRASQELAVKSYQQGLIQILTLLDSYRSTLNAQSAHLAVKRQLLNNRIALYLALGGDV
ncbi:MAG: transporter [Methylomonas sp.]|nr:MAG: transporter [Methylomonas sp.]